MYSLYKKSYIFTNTEIKQIGARHNRVEIIEMFFNDNTHHKPWEKEITIHSCPCSVRSRKFITPVNNLITDQANYSCSTNTRSKTIKPKRLQLAPIAYAIKKGSCFNKLFAISRNERSFEG